MNSINIKMPSLPEYGEIRRLMVRTFPKNERLPLWLLRLGALRKDVDFGGYYHDGTFCGISYTVQGEHMVFVLYLAIHDAVRSMGHGSAILAHINQYYRGKSISLNVEPLDRRRKTTLSGSGASLFMRETAFQTRGIPFRIGRSAIRFCPLRKPFPPMNTAMF